MAEKHVFLALDYGAESGRGILVTLEGGKVSMEEIHRFANRPVRLAGTLHWDIPFLLAECVQALKICAERGVTPASIGVDTWGVDFGLLGSDGRLLGLPVHYRDSRTDNIHEYSNQTMSQEDIYTRTALDPWQISTLFQLLAMQRDGWPALDAAETLLQIPDLLTYFLTGVKAVERSHVQTGNLLDTKGEWCWDVIDAFELPRKLFGRLIGPAEVIGPLQESVRQETGLGEVPVVAVCGHDTSSAVATVPGEGENWAYLSCGTWSILGTMLHEPITDLACWRKGFTNELTYRGWYLAKNILGLWLVQQLRAKWDQSDDPWDYDRITAEASNAPGGLLVNAVDESLMAPADMEAALVELLRKSDQAEPDSRGQLVRGVLESLALEYAVVMDDIAAVTGRRPDAVYMVGGGIHNKLLCQLTANACGVPIHAGVDQCTAIGNALGQALGLGIVQSVDEMRQIVRNSFEVTTYQPQDAAAWQEKKQQYKALKG